MLSFLASPTFRRIVYGLVGVLIPLLNSKLGLNLSDTQVGEMLLTVVALITSSTVNQMHARSVAAGEAAAANPGPVVNS
jgi:hypothetical protein